MTDYDEAETALDLFLFGNIWNHWIRGNLGAKYEVTFNGDHYLVLDINTGRAYPFTVEIKRGAAHDWTQDIEDQEWEVEEIVEED